MKGAWNLLGVGDCPIRFIMHGRAGGQAKSISPVLTVSDLCRRLGKSRRHVYRFIHSGRLQPCGRVLDQWLFAPEEPARCAARAVPRFLRPWLWDVRLSDLASDRHRDFILSRLLELGDWQALRWVVRTYPRQAIRAFLQQRGAAALSARSWQFWKTQFGLAGSRPRSWRRAGPHWRGLS